MTECCKELEKAIVDDWIIRHEYVDCSPAKDVYYHAHIVVGGEDYESLYFRHCPFCGELL